MKRTDYTHRSEYFYGEKISEYGLKEGYVDYRTLAKAFDAVLNNDILEATTAAGLGWWEQVNGCADYSDEIDTLTEKIDELTDELNAAEDDAQADEIAEKIAELEAEAEELQEEQDTPPEVFQWYIIDDAGAELLQELTDEIVYYNGALNMYLWGVTHYGTAWDYVLTDIKIDLTAEA